MFRWILYSRFLNVCLITSLGWMMSNGMYYFMAGPAQPPPEKTTKAVVFDPSKDNRQDDHIRNVESIQTQLMSDIQSIKKDLAETKITLAAMETRQKEIVMPRLESIESKAWAGILFIMSCALASMVYVIRQYVMQNVEFKFKKAD